MFNPSQRAGFATVRSFWAACMTVFAAVAVVTGCGGGVGTGGTGVGSYASGSITGFGSIIVNSVRYDDSSASVLDSDDASRSNGELKLGMTVEVEGGEISSDTSGNRSAKASRIRFGSELVGPVTRVDVANKQLTILGQTVVVSADTVLDGSLSGGLAGLRVGTLVEVYAQVDAANNLYRATRIEPRTSASAWVLRGVVSALDNAAKTLRIGPANVVWTTADSVPADLALGRLVRLQLATSTDTSGRFVARSFATAFRAPPDLNEVELEGAITAFTSAQRFSVNGLPVDASASSFPDGTAGLRLGARVTVKGRSSAGTLLATSVSIESDDKIEQRGFDFKGPISAVNTTAQTITVRGQEISTARSDLRLDNGSRSDLRVNREVDVNAQLNAARTQLEAVRITLR